MHGVLGMRVSFFIIFCIFFAFSLYAQDMTFTAADNPNDDGGAILLEWNVPLSFPEMTISRSIDKENYIEIATVTPLMKQFIDDENIEDGQEYFYKLSVLNIEGETLQSFSASAIAKAEWFNTDKISLLIMTILLGSAITYFIFSARKGKRLYIRKISGLDTIEEAVGRATEMGKPLLFVPGIMDLDDMQTIAGLNILGHLAEKVAQYDSTIHVPVCRSMVLSTAKEIVKEAYLRAGRPDAFKPDSVFYLTDDQFGYVAGVDGIILREKPAATFYLGAFYAESLILAETGFESGAIQIAGTAMPTQIPFFVAACDYTLIGEELFAASAYLSNEPNQLGSLKGQDVGKAIIIFTLLVGVVLEMFGIHFLKDFLATH